MKPNFSSSTWGVAFVLMVLGWAVFNVKGAEEIQIEKVFGPETPTGEYKHPATITELKNGDLYLAYYGGAGEYAVETSVFGSRRAKGTRTWTRPEAIARNPFHSMGNPVLWEAPDGVAWLFFVVRPGATWST